MMKKRRMSNSKTKESREATESKTRSKTIKEVKSNVIMPAGRGKPKPNKKRTCKRSHKRRASQCSNPEESGIPKGCRNHTKTQGKGPRSEAGAMAQTACKRQSLLQG